jgi:hypothetical protein
MERREFILKTGLLLGASIVAPSVVLERAPEKEELPWHKHYIAKFDPRRCIQSYRDDFGRLVQLKGTCNGYQHSKPTPFACFQWDDGQIPELCGVWAIRFEDGTSAVEDIQRYAKFHQSYPELSRLWDPRTSPVVAKHIAIDQELGGRFFA